MEALHISGTKVADISVLRGCPLTFLRFHGCTELTDLSPLADCKGLVSITLPTSPKNVEMFRAFPKLDRIAFKEDPSHGNRPEHAVAEFWREHDAAKK